MIGWHRKGFRLFWTWRVRHGQPGRPPVSTNDDETVATFARIEKEAGGLDILVNSAWGGYEQMVENGVFKWPLPFWQQPLHRWRGMIDARLRAADVSACQAARLMVPRRRGLIINITSWPAQKHIGNVIYGVSKAATDKMIADMAHGLRPHGVAVLSLYPWAFGIKKGV